MTALHASFVTVDAILIVLIAVDFRAGERRLAYPLSLVFFVVIHALMVPVGASEAWGSVLSWYTRLPFWT